MKEESKVREGIPMTEEEIKDWQQAFIDIEESIANIDKENKDGKRRDKV